MSSRRSHPERKQSRQQRKLPIAATDRREITFRLSPNSQREAEAREAEAEAVLPQEKDAEKKYIEGRRIKEELGKENETTSLAVNNN